VCNARRKGEEKRAKGESCFNSWGGKGEKEESSFRLFYSRGVGGGGRKKWGFAKEGVFPSLSVARRREGKKKTESYPPQKRGERLLEGKFALALGRNKGGEKGERVAKKKGGGDSTGKEKGRKRGGIHHLLRGKHWRGKKDLTFGGSKRERGGRRIQPSSEREEEINPRYIEKEKRYLYFVYMGKGSLRRRRGGGFPLMRKT